jgi:hypothetical protein
VFFGPKRRGRPPRCAASRVGGQLLVRWEVPEGGSRPRKSVLIAALTPDTGVFGHLLAREGHLLAGFERDELRVRRPGDPLGARKRGKGAPGRSPTPVELPGGRCSPPPPREREPQLFEITLRGRGDLEGKTHPGCPPGGTDPVQGALAGATHRLPQRRRGSP